jgi:hypothetical protein
MELGESSPLTPEVQSRFEDAMRRFQAECFWYWDITKPVSSRATAQAVIHQLRTYGNKEAWRTAAGLVRCL